MTRISRLLPSEPVNRIAWFYEQIAPRQQAVDLIEYTEDQYAVHRWMIRYTAERYVDAMLAVERWAENETLAFSWAEGNRMLEAIMEVRQLIERLNERSE